MAEDASLNFSPVTTTALPLVLSPTIVRKIVPASFIYAAHIRSCTLQRPLFADVNQDDYEP
jgi:hypothetical protein